MYNAHVTEEQLFSSAYFFCCRSQIEIEENLELELDDLSNQIHNGRYCMGNLNDAL